MRVAVIGGTGAEGFGLSLRLARAGHEVVIGSRSAERGADAAARAREAVGDGARLEGTANEEAAAGAELVVVTVPFAGQAEIYRSLRPHVPPGRIVVDTTTPLASAVGRPAWHVLRPWEGSAAEQAKAILDPGVRLVAAFHTVAAEALRDLERPVESDVLVCGAEAEAKAAVGELIEAIPGMRWVDAGPLSMARVVEPLTALLISVNRGYGIRDAGFRITGRDRWGRPGPS
ncbi:MAG TPA: NADPH-dependent F420 reductase [Actinomycetota bacterium]|nr:NADPH-dependent F420 reductase [Actinomycetota bacterium]